MIKKISKKFWDWVLDISLVDEKINEVIKETKKRAGRVKEEVCDVVEAVKEVSKQVKDIPGALNGEARKGRKKKKK
jgi:methyl-accepting chemotaxis protein